MGFVHPYRDASNLQLGEIRDQLDGEIARKTDKGFALDDRDSPDTFSRDSRLIGKGADDVLGANATLETHSEEDFDLVGMGNLAIASFAAGSSGPARGLLARRPIERAA